MTLIAIFNSSKPTLISDVLLSSAQTPPAVSVTPTGVSIDPAKYVSADYSPLHFQQKTAILHGGKVAIAVAGDFKRAQKAACALRDDIRNGVLCQSNLQEWGQEADKKFGKSVSMFIAWNEPESWLIGKIGDPFTVRRTASGTEVFWAGSGSEWLQTCMLTLGECVEQIGPLEEAERIRMLAIAQTGYHLFSERVLGLKDHFGGGFQITTLHEDLFYPVTGITYIHMTVLHNEKGIPYTIKILPSIVIQGYDSGDLTFDTLSLSDIERLDLGDRFEFRGRFERSCLPVKPLLTGNNLPPPPPSLERVRYFHIQRAHIWNGSIVHLGSSQMLQEGTAPCPIEIVEHPDNTVSIFVRKTELKMWQQEGPSRKTLKKHHQT